MKLISVIFALAFSLAAYCVETPTYDDLKPTIDLAIKAIDEKDVDTIFNIIVFPADLVKAKKDEERFEEAKAAFMTEKAENLKKILVSLSDITPEYYLVSQIVYNAIQSASYQVHEI